MSEEQQKDPQQLSFLQPSRHQTATIDGNWAVYDRITKRIEFVHNFATARYLATLRNKADEATLQ